MTQPARSEQVPAKDAKQERERSTIEFPYTSLDDAAQVAKAIHKAGGNEARLELLAAELGHSTTESGGFRQRIGGARMFGLASSAQGMVTLTALGARIVDENTEQAARIEAFLTVPLYKSIYEEFKAGVLPPNEGLENKMVALGVAQKQKDRARQAFQRSAKEAGFFAYGTNRLVYPAGKPAVGGAAKPIDKPADQPKGGGSSGGGGGEPPHKNPFIQGLLSKLPAEDTEWSIDDRRKWLQLAISVFEVTYKSASGDSGALTINQVSAK
jgi:hypothetical protein